MRKGLFRIFSWVIVLSLTFNTMKSQSVNNNQEHLRNAKSNISDFNKEMEPEYLHDAANSLINVDINIEDTYHSKKIVRKSCLELWIKILNELDQNIDTKFNPDEQIAISLPVFGDSTHQSKQDSEIAAINNDRKLKSQALQILLIRENEFITLESKKFIDRSYTSLIDDHFELRSAFEENIKNAKRKEEFLKIIGSNEH